MGIQVNPARVTKLQQFNTYEEVRQAEAEGQEIISSQFVDKLEANGELRSRLVSRHRFDLHNVGKTLAMANSSPTKGLMRRK